MRGPASERRWLSASSRRLLLDSSIGERTSAARWSRSLVWVLGGAVTPETLQTQPMGAGAGRDLESLCSSCPSHWHSSGQPGQGLDSPYQTPPETGHHAGTHGLACPDVRVLHSTFGVNYVPAQVSDESPSPR